MLKSLSAALLFGLIAAGSASAAELTELKVLYVGSEGASAYVSFLGGKVARIEAKTREEFKVRDAAAFDVILLDWPQSEETRDMRKLKTPLVCAMSGKSRPCCWEARGSIWPSLGNSGGLRVYLHGPDGIRPSRAPHF